MTDNISFGHFFKAASGNEPFPWQVRLYDKFVSGNFPDSANIPTGLGKTSIIAIWLFALALHPEKTPRRLVYVVNRRTVVDQTTTEVEKLREALLVNPELKDISDRLRSLCALPLSAPEFNPLAVSTLRGQFADNREWSADPSRPAVIIGTVDMIGSGLLFNRYTVGFKLRPHHAAFLAQDVLLVHDEAHLEPAFQQLLRSIVAEQARSNDLRKLRVIELSATTRSVAPIESFKIGEDDEQNEFVYKRLHAAKKLSLAAYGNGEDERAKIIKFALARQQTGRAILIYVRSVESATKVAAELDKGERKGHVLVLTGTMRGKERDELVNNPIFQRFLPESARANGVAPADGSVFLVATSAGEVGINISADDLICDLSTYESMAQRFGRINRFGERNDSMITVVYPQEFPHAIKIRDAEQAVVEGKKDAKKILREIKDKEASGISREKTLALLRKLNGDASPAALEKLSVNERITAFSPQPMIRVATDVQFDAWALTSIREGIAARPPVAPYLHGKAKGEKSETHVAWRDDVDIIQGNLLEAYPPEELLEDFPLKPHELLRDTTDRIVETLGKIIAVRQKADKSLPDAWILNEFGSVRILPLTELASAAKARKELTKAEEIKLSELKSVLADSTLILSPSIGGCRQGLLDSDSENADDIADIEAFRCRIRNATPDIPEKYVADYRLIRIIDTQLGDEGDNLESSGRYWLWLESKNNIGSEKRSTRNLETLAEHSKAVVANAAAIAEKLVPMPCAGEPDLRRCLIAASELHDSGKNRRQWQFGIGNTVYDPAKPDTVFAKPGGSLRPRNLLESYRHEFGSLSDATTSNNFASLSPIERDIVLHLIAAHHGRGRPHFPSKEVFDYKSSPDTSVAIAAEVPSRFARLQRRFGRWGLVWLESLLRAADYSASAGIVADTVIKTDCLNAGISEQPDEAIIQSKSVATISLHVDIANPGQYFACCGVFELVSRLAQDALAHFEQDAVSKQWHFVITNAVTPDREIITLQSLIKKFIAAQITAIEPDDAPLTPLSISAPFNFLLDWWRYEGREIGKLKTWAGQMSVCSVANDMKRTLEKELARNASATQNLLSTSSVENAGQPYYFDANYAANAQAQDVGFSVDKLKKGGIKFRTAIIPAVELLCLVGLQRARPLLAVNDRGREHLYDYFVWKQDIPISIVAAVIAGVLPENCLRFRFANPSRAEDYRAFMPAVLSDSY
jgi:CRISPR-associated endonuclease/helicase Cas3